MEGVQVANRTDTDGVRKATPKEIAEYKNREAMTVKKRFSQLFINCVTYESGGRCAACLRRMVQLAK